jgi:hypothetical protein
MLLMLLLLLLIRTRREKAFRCMFRNLRKGTPFSSLPSSCHRNSSRPRDESNHG